MKVNCVDTALALGSIENLNEEVKGTNQRLDRAFDQQGQYYRERTAKTLTEKQRLCHQAFKRSDYEHQKDINPNRQPGTCEWALQSPDYLRWRDSCHNDLLWISADPGCGKSVLAKSLIDHDLTVISSTMSICYFFSRTTRSRINLL